MPIIAPDVQLQRRLAAYVESRGGTISAAAAELGLSITLVWRFLRTGSAIERNRRLLQNALDAKLSEVQDATESAKINIESAKELQRATELVGMLRILLQALESFVSIDGKSISERPSQGWLHPARGATESAR